MQFAGLYFGGRTSAGGRGAAAPAAAQRDRVKLRVPGAGSYETLVARALDSSAIAKAYGGFVNVTPQGELHSSANAC